MSELKNKSKKAFSWDLLGRFLNQGGTFIISIFLARLLTPDEFGLVAMVTVLIGFSQVFVDMGLGISLVQRKTVSTVHYGSVFWFNVVVGFFLSGLFFLLSPYIAHFYDEPQLVNITRALSFVFLINAFGQVVRYRLQRELNFKLPVICNAVAVFVGGGFGIWIALMGYGPWAIVVNSLLNNVVKNFLLLILSKFKPEMEFRWQALKELWAFGMNMFVASIISNVFQNIDSIIIGKLFNASSLGFYSRAKNLKNIIIQNVTGSLSVITFPALASVQDEEERYVQIIHKMLHLISLLSFYVCVLFFVVGNDAILIVYGDQWGFAVPYFRLIMLSAYAFPLSVILVNILSTRGNSKVFLKLGIIKNTIATVNFIFGFYFGIEGFLIGFALITVINVNFNIIFASREINLKTTWFYKIFWRYILIAVVSGTIVWYGFDWLSYNIYLHGLVAGLMVTVIYFGINYLLKSKGIIIFMDELRPYINRIRLQKSN